MQGCDTLIYILYLCSEKHPGIFLGGGGNLKKIVCLLVYDYVHWRRRQATEMNKTVPTNYGYNAQRFIHIKIYYFALQILMKGGGAARAPFATPGHALGGSVYVCWGGGGGGSEIIIILFCKCA